MHAEKKGWNFLAGAFIPWELKAYAMRGLLVETLGMGAFMRDSFERRNKYFSTFVW